MVNHIVFAVVLMSPVLTLGSQETYHWSDFT